LKAHLNRFGKTDHPSTSPTTPVPNYPPPIIFIN
jgi:hypothetical protein